MENEWDKAEQKKVNATLINCFNKLNYYLCILIPSTFFTINSFINSGISLYVKKILLYGYGIIGRNVCSGIKVLLAYVLLTRLFLIID